MSRLASAKAGCTRRCTQGRSRPDSTSTPACRSLLWRSWAPLVRPPRVLFGAAARGGRSRRPRRAWPIGVTACIGGAGAPAQRRSRLDSTSTPACRGFLWRSWAPLIRPPRVLFGAAASGGRSRRPRRVWPIGVTPCLCQGRLHAAPNDQAAQGCLPGYIWTTHRPAQQWRFGTSAATVLVQWPNTSGLASVENAMG